MEPTNITPPPTIQVVPPTQNKPRRHRVNWLKSGFAGVVVLAIAVSAYVFIRDNQSVKATAIATVQINSSSFLPGTIKIKKNQSVTWTNNDATGHEVASDPYPSGVILPALSSSSLNKGDSYTFTFEKTGTFTYHDPLNPAALKGTVVVE
jgi:plastocyanin